MIVCFLLGSFPKGRVPERPETGALPWSPTDLRYLTVRIPYDERDLHSTVWQGRVYFRPWFGAATGEDLLALRP